MQPKFIGLLIGLSAFASLGVSILYDDGMVGQTKKPLRNPYFQVKGCFCHGDTASPRVRAWIAGPESLAAGAQARYTINVAKDSNIAAGFDVAAFLGELDVYDSLGTHLMRIPTDPQQDSLELTHTDPKLAYGSDTISWSFWYRAPRIAGIIDTLYACGNSVDTSYDPSGDFWNYAPNFQVRVLRPNDVPGPLLAGSVALSQNYPNPFNPVTVIRFRIPVSAFVSLSVFDLTGKRVAELLDATLVAGSHEATFDARGRASGVYVYRLELRPGGPEGPARLVAAQKMLLLK